MKKYLSILLVVIMAFALAEPMSVHAAEGVRPEVIYPTGDLKKTNLHELEPGKEPEHSGQKIETYAEIEFTNEIELYTVLEEVVKEAILEGVEGLDITGLQLPVNDYQLYHLDDFSPYLSNGIEIGAWYSGDYYAYLEITNTMTLDETKAYFAEVDKKLAEVNQIFADDMSEAEKALTLYDYLIYECEYDYDNLVNGTLPQDSYKSGGILMKGTGVCQAYAYAYMYVMNSIGIECHVTSSDAMNHAWNIIKIDGSYYHVDCTWGDPVPDRMGIISHEYFLLSDSLIQEREHTGWDLTQYACDNTKYDHAYWDSITSQIINVGNYTYYIQDGSIRKLDNTNQKVTELKSLGYWYVWEDSTGYWIGDFSGLFLYDNELYYNTATEIRKISLDGQNDELVFAPDTSKGYIYGTRKRGTKIQYRLKQNPNEGAIRAEGEVDLPKKEEPEPPKPQNTFDDVTEQDWYYDAVMYVSSNKIMTGLTDTTFGPNVTLTRSQFATILYRMNGEPAIEYNTKFPDVPKGQWYTNGVLWASSIEVVNGYGDGSFGPDDKITREQMALMMHRYAKYKGYDVSEIADINSFADAKAVNSYAKEAFKWAVGSKIINGKAGNALEPQGNATRAECATIIMKFMGKYEK